METAAFPVLMAEEPPIAQQELDRLKFAYAVGLNLANHSNFDVVPIDQTRHLVGGEPNRVVRRNYRTGRARHSIACAEGR